MKSLTLMIIILRLGLWLIIIIYWLRLRLFDILIIIEWVFVLFNAMVLSSNRLRYSNFTAMIPVQVRLRLDNQH